MREVPSGFAEQVERGGPLTIRVSSWLSGQRLTLGGRPYLPVVSRSWAIADVADARASGELVFEVPNTREWWPAEADHPLAAYGQRLWAQVGYGDERVSAGWFRILDAPEDAGHTLKITAKGLSHEIERARFLRGFQTRPGWSRVHALRWIVAPMAVVLDPGIDDKPMPVTTWAEDRTQAVIDITDTWPARWYIGDDAALHIAPVWDDNAPAVPQFKLTGGAGGGLVSLTSKPRVVDPPNGFRVSNIPEGDAAEVVGTWVVPNGPLRWADGDMPGPYGQKPEYFSSSVLPGDELTLRNVAKNMTLRGLRRKWSAEATCRPDPRLQIGDVGLAASNRAGFASMVRLTGYTLTATQMDVTVAALGEVPL